MQPLAQGAGRRVGPGRQGMWNFPNLHDDAPPGTGVWKEITEMNLSRDAKISGLPAEDAVLMRGSTSQGSTSLYQVRRRYQAHGRRCEAHVTQLRQILEPRATHEIRIDDNSAYLETTVSLSPGCVLWGICSTAGLHALRQCMRRRIPAEGCHWARISQEPCR